MKIKGRKITELLAVNRRNFLKLVVGGAVGTGLSPLPWKLTDDIAIWTQNWPWIPVPSVGEFLHEKTICTLCPGGCGIEVRKVDERAVKIEGRTDYPVNPGGICPLGMGGLQLLYNEMIRFTGPMRRVGERGEGKFVGITWDEALSLLAARISGLRKKGNPEGLAAIDGSPSQSTMSLLVERLLQAVGSPNYTRIPTADDSYAMAKWLMEGNDSPGAYDLENADFVLSFGAGLLEGWGAPGRIINAWSLWRENPGEGSGTRIVQIESRASNTASKADQRVAVIPGTESALALGIAHVIIKEGLYDQEFTNNFSFGFDDWTSSDGKKRSGFKTLVLEKYSPLKVAKITGLAPEEIVSLGQAFAMAKTPVALAGKGKGALNGSLYEFMAVHSLNALVGNINNVGGLLARTPLPLTPFPKTADDPIARSGLQKPRIDQAGSLRYPFAHSLINKLTDAVLERPECPLDTLLVFASNPAFTQPDGGALKKALERIPFIVSFSPYKDETAYMADIILPDHNPLEKMDDVVWPSGLQYALYGLTRPVVKPLYDTRNAGDVILQLAKQLGDPVKSAFPWETYEDILKSRAQGLYDAQGGRVSYDGTLPVWKQMREAGSVSPEYDSFPGMWEKIRSGGFWYRPAHTYKNWDKIFKTPSGKFEFFSLRLEQAVSELARQNSEQAALREMEINAKGDEVYLPHFEPLISETARGPFPLRMIPYEMINLSSGWIPNPPFLNKTLFDDQLRKEESFLEINPETAAQYKLKDGDRVILESPRGKIRVRVNLFEGAMPGIVYLPLGLGHRAYDEFRKDKGENPNSIIHPGKDPLSGHPNWWDTPVRVEKI